MDSTTFYFLPFSLMALLPSISHLAPLIVINTITSSLLTLVILLLCPLPSPLHIWQTPVLGNLSVLSGLPYQTSAWSHSKLMSTHYKWILGLLHHFSLINWSFTWASLSTFPPFCELSTPKPLLFIHLWHYFVFQWENALPSMAVCKLLLLLFKIPLSKNPPWSHTNFSYQPLI